MDLLSQKNIIIEYWQYLLPLFTLGLSILLLNFSRKPNKVVTPQKSVEKDLDPSEIESRPRISDEDLDCNYLLFCQWMWNNLWKLQNRLSSDDADALTPALEGVNHRPYEGIKKTFPGGIEKFYEMVNDRRSVRKYSTRPVDWKTIEKCIHAAG